MAHARAHEGLEVLPVDNAANAPEVNPHALPYQGSKDPISGYTHVVEPQKRPFGLSLWSVCTVVAVITALVVGAGVGGGLGAALAECKSSNEHSSSPVQAVSSACPTTTASEGKETSSPKLYKPESPDQVGNLTLPDACSTEDGRDDYTTTNGYVFTYTCGWDFPGNDLVPMIAYTAYDCMSACAMYTELNSGRGNPLCDSIAFRQDMSTSVDEHGANCWLKNGTRDRFPKNERVPVLLYARRNT
ncbi:hypothetical protein BKA59DRAFT_425683 [Fusarium tricinctum]|uniref:Apple domain-containing protein n=1 Tax=Fusarium tricinctum TaxID=61284 RepID=A0A8K0W7B9_9HYPO|nr:hypothetical protein BKA59DRAFT_425683 [Fusarium tricinctum]